MAKKKTTETAVEATAAAEEKERVPVFVLRADKRGHLRALMAALQELPGEMADGLRTLREFDLYEENHR